LSNNDCQHPRNSQRIVSRLNPMANSLERHCESVTIDVNQDGFGTTIMSQSLIDHDGLEAVRRKPGMYIGGTDQRALNCCVLELIANSIEEHLAGRGALITVTLHDDGSLSVTDQAGGISVAPHPQRQIPFIELALTTLHVPDDHLKRPYRVLGHCGVGTKCVNAVSEWMGVTTVWEGREYAIQFARGRIMEPLRQTPQPRLARGTVIRFKPDPEIFKALTFDRNFLAARLDHLAVLHPGLSCVLEDERPNPAGRSLTSLYHYANGITDFLKATSAGAVGPLQLEPLVLKREADGIRIALGFQFTETANVSILSFANSSPTSKGGVHLQGFFKGLADAFNALSSAEPGFHPDDFRKGLNAFIAVWLTDPHYGGSTKDELINPEVETAVRQLIVPGVTQWATEFGEQAKWLVESLDEERRAKADPNEG
jgi:DNA gyrase subunit B